MMSLNGSRVRGYLLASSALLTIPGIAQAQSADPAGGLTAAYREAHASTTDLTNAYREAHDSSATPDITGEFREAQAGEAKVDPVGPGQQIVVANPGTPTTARDPVNITGVGQMIINNGDGSIGLCTGTLINPRTVLFAAHCVNSRNQTAYGANSGGVPIAFGFETYTRANGVGQVDELFQWYTGPNANKTNIAQAFYNANFVAYNQLSLEPPAQGFLYGDVAVASLDTPAANVPTWALMFSPLPAPGTITAAGTGYNVGLVGYGGLGTGQTGQTGGSDFRRRAAENVLGALTDLQTFESFLFGGAPNGLRQNLYFLDFDDPRRGSIGASPFDFNAFRDNARVTNGTPTEGVTAPGDSGGPLILQNFAKQMVIGVLSGGYSRFYAAQAPYSYGAVSFYQPLYLYWDWIAANNPYHYVTAKVGDGSWTDATRWTTTLDPAYMILTNGQPVNGIPTLTGEQSTGTSGDFGQICFQNSTSSDCLDTRTGTETVNSNPIGTATNQPDTTTVASAAGQPAVARLAEGTDEGMIREISPQAAAVTPPAATLANGLPGATNFVPNNVDPNRAAGVAPRYFDVTLSAAGTTTLSGASVTIDRLTLGGSQANLVVASGASLTSLMNVNHFAGTNTVNGTLTSVGDYSLMGGGLLGSGRINAPFLTSVLGTIAPGTLGTTGTLTVGGNLVLSSGNTLLIDIAGNNVSDRLAVVAGTAAGSGTANIGGRVLFSPVAGSTVRFGDVYTILTATGGVTGTFSPSSSLSAILTPQFIYSTNAVQARIIAGQYINVVQNTPVQVAYANLLDRNRATNYAALSGLYGVLDLQSAATIQSTLESWAPRTGALARSLSTAAVDSVNRLYRGRVASMDLNGGMDGSLAVIGNPLQLASAASSGTRMPGDAMTASDSGDAVITPNQFGEGTRGFIAGGYIDGKGRSMLTAIPFGGKDKFDGWYAAAGIETQLGDNAAIGFGMSYSNLDGTTGGVGQRVDAELIQGTLYGKAANASGLTLDAIFSAGWLGIDTRRAATLGGTAYELRSKDDTLAVSTEVGLGMMFGEGIKFGPRIAGRASNIGFSKTIETGGPMALRLDRREQGSAQGLAGASLSGSAGSFKPYASVYYVHEFLDHPAFTGANFTNGIGPNSLFALNGTDRNWGEASVGVSFGSERMTFSLGADTTFLRKDVSNQAYRGSVQIRF